MADLLILIGWVALLVVLPIVTLYVAANSQKRSPMFAAFGVLSWFGVIIGLLWMAWSRRNGGGA